MGIFRRSRGYRVGSPVRVERRANALTASGFRVKSKDSEMMRRLVQPWQARSFSYYDQVPEIKFAGQFYARLLSPLKLYAAETDESGDLVETANADAIAALERIQDPGGGRTGLMGAYGRLMFLTGECYLFVTLDPETGLEQWEILSTDELRITSGIYIRYKAPSLLAEEFHDPGLESNQEGEWVPVEDDTAVAYRLWQRHPRYSMLADSTMMGVLDICEELLLLTRAVRARARSRLAGSGILLIDERISPPPDEPVPDEDMREDPLLGPLVEHITTPIVDEGSAGAVSPLLLRAAAPDGGKVEDLMYHLQLIDPMQLYPETGLRMECVKRLAIGLDMPPEELIGMTEANHWTAWMVDEQTWKAHGQPKAQQFCDDLTASYYRPYLRDVLGLSDWMNFQIGYDATAIINHPDRTADAKDLYDKRAIGKRALREAAGFDEEDAPTQDELAEMIGIAVRDASLAWDGIPSVKAGGIEPEPGVIVQAGVETGTPQAAKTGATTEKGPPKNEPDSATDKTTVGSLAAQVVGASDLALLRAREVAGSRVRSLAKKDPEALRLIDGVRGMDVCATLGRERVRALRVSERDLVACAHALIMDAFRVYQLHDEEAAKAIAETVEQHAARTLYDKHITPLPIAFGVSVEALLRRRSGNGKVT